MQRQDDEGFTLIELLAAISLMLIMLAFSVGPIRNYWFTQSLVGAEGEVVSELRRMHQQAVSQTHPLVFGARFRSGSSDWSVLRFNPDNNTCTEVERRSLSGGVVVEAASFNDLRGVTAACRATLTPAAPASDQMVFFFARGDATAGTMSVRHPSLQKPPRTITVVGLTGRVDGS